MPAFYQMDARFGAGDQRAGPATWIGLQGAVSLVEPGRFDDALQIGFVLAEAIAAGTNGLRQALPPPAAGEAGAADERPAGAGSELDYLDRQ